MENSASHCCPEIVKSRNRSLSGSGVVTSPFAVVLMIAKNVCFPPSSSDFIRKRAVSLAETVDRKVAVSYSFDHYQSLSKYYIDNEKMKSPMINELAQLKQELQKKNEQLENCRHENENQKKRIEELQTRSSQNERDLISVKSEHDLLVSKNLKFEYKIQTMETSMTEMIQLKDSIIQSQNDQFTTMYKKGSEREASIMELYKKQLKENQQLQLRSKQLRSKLKHNLKDLANLTNLVNQLQLESVKNKKEYETSIQQFRATTMNQIQIKMSEIQQQTTTNNLTSTTPISTVEKTGAFTTR